MHLIKTRINTHYNALQKIFGKATSLQSALAPYLAASLSTVQPFQHNNQISAKATYLLSTEREACQLKLYLAQSTSQTNYCFDIFITLAPHCANLKKTPPAVEQFLEALRQHYNGDWVINDESLTLSILQ